MIISVGYLVCILPVECKLELIYDDYVIGPFFKNDPAFIERDRDRVLFIERVDKNLIICRVNHYEDL